MYIYSANKVGHDSRTIQLSIIVHGCDMVTISDHTTKILEEKKGNHKHFKVDIKLIFNVM